ncbi:MAG: NAD-dependent epimerase/dehydratase family protein [Acidimicrobiia bacterium]
MRAFVTGAAGFIGSHLVDRLVSLGHDVVGSDRCQWSGAPCRHLVVDLSEPAAAPLLDDWAAWADVVFHLAARSGVRAGGPKVEASRQRDILTATSRLLDATPFDTRLVVTSSSSVYGGALRSGNGLRPSHEDDQLRPQGGYAVAKTAMEAMCMQWARRGGTAAIARPFTVVGERQREDMALSLWLDAIMEGAPVTVLGSLDRARDVTDVRKVVDGLIAMAASGFSGVVNLGAGRPRTLREMIAAVEHSVGRDADIMVRPATVEEAEATFADTARCRTELGVDLTTDLDDVVHRQLRHRVETTKRRLTA